MEKLRDISIKPAKQDDVQKLATLSHRWCSEMGFSVVKDEVEKDLERIISIGVCIYAEREGEVIGYVCGNPVYHFWINALYMHEHYFFVTPEIRRSGVAATLLTMFERVAEKAHCKGVIISPNRFGSANPEHIQEYLIRRGYNTHGYSMLKEV